MSQISTQRLSKTFADGTRALHDVSLTVENGEIVCVVGPSGCGKTTFLNLVAGFTPYTDGQILVDGRPISGPGPDRGVVFQEDALFPWLSALKNVTFGLEVRGIEKSEGTERARRSLELVGLAGFEDHLPRALSGGMKQRVAIARVLVNDPAVMLMDEPFSALDTFTRTTMQKEVLRIWQQTRCTIVFVTHNVEEAVLLGAKIVVMNRSPEGGAVVGEISVDLPHPRDTTGTEFNEYKRRVLQALHMDAKV